MIIHHRHQTVEVDCCKFIGLSIECHVKRSWAAFIHRTQKKIFKHNYFAIQIKTFNHLGNNKHAKVITLYTCQPLFKSPKLISRKPLPRILPLRNSFLSSTIVISNPSRVTDSESGLTMTTTTRRQTKINGRGDSIELTVYPTTL